MTFELSFHGPNSVPNAKRFGEWMLRLMNHRLLNPASKSDPAFGEPFVLDLRGPNPLA